MDLVVCSLIYALDENTDENSRLRSLPAIRTSGLIRCAMVSFMLADASLRIVGAYALTIFLLVYSTWVHG